MQFKCSGTKAIVKEFQIITVPIVAVLAISAYVEAECLYYSYKDKNYSIIKQYSYNLQFTIAKKVPKPIYVKTPTLTTIFTITDMSSREVPILGVPVLNCRSGIDGDHIYQI